MDPNFPPPTPDPFWNPRPNPGSGPVDHHGRVVRPGGSFGSNVARDPANPYGSNYGINNGSDFISPYLLPYDVIRRQKLIPAPSQSCEEKEFFRKYEERLARHEKFWLDTCHQNPMLHSFSLQAPLMEDERELLERLEKREKFFNSTKGPRPDFSTVEDQWLSNAIMCQGSFRFQLWKEAVQKGYARHQRELEAESRHKNQVERQRAQIAKRKETELMAERHRAQVEYEAMKRAQERRKITLMRRRACVLGVGVLAAGVYAINKNMYRIPAVYNSSYEAKAKIIDEAVKGTNYSVAHMPGYSIILDMDLRDLQNIGSRHYPGSSSRSQPRDYQQRKYFYNDDYTLREDGPENTYPMMVDPRNVVAIITDERKFGPDIMLNLKNSCESEISQNNFYRDQHMQSIDGGSLSIAYASQARKNELQDKLSGIAKNVTVLEPRDKYRSGHPVRLLVYYPQKSGFSMVNGQTYPAGP